MAYLIIIIIVFFPLAKTQILCKKYRLGRDIQEFTARVRKSNALRATMLFSPTVVAKSRTSYRRSQIVFMLDALWKSQRRTPPHIARSFASRVRRWRQSRPYEDRYYLLRATTQSSGRLQYILVYYSTFVLSIYKICILWSYFPSSHHLPLKKKSVVRQNNCIFSVISTFVIGRYFSSRLSVHGIFDLPIPRIV